MKSTRRPLLVAAVGFVLSIAGQGCMSRPVSKTAPTTKDLVTQTLSQQAVDKIDLLFAIDNSQSMGDKQAILKDAVPNLIQGLLSPPCVNRETRAKTGKLAKYDGDHENNFGCDAGDEPEFKPITDMHIGVVSSSLGDFGGFRNDGSAHVCKPGSARENDRAHLLVKDEAGKDVANAPEGFLAWFPSSEENADPKRHPSPKSPITDLAGGLVPSFGDLVVGVGQDGCGLESQLESVYRFLIQPDPWDQVLKFDIAGKADIGTGVDDEILRQRADFLRPDSLVAVIMLTDEDDSSSDPLAVDGFGYTFMAQIFPGSNVTRGKGRGTTMPRGTSVCETDPNSEDCASCATLCDPNTAWCQKIKSDPNCLKNGGFYGPDEEDVNIRFHHMKERYGVDPQFPIKRYVDGFTKTNVPDRTGEHTIQESADGKRSISAYVGAAGCTNPLFAASLPRSSEEELCKTKKGTRSPDKVFFALVGGVPNQLLHFDASGTAEAAERNRLSESDWTKILGKNPLAFDRSGIDPHMIQSVEPRKALAAGGASSSPRGENGSDPVHGREWNTNKRDLQYACTFELPKPKDCSMGGSCDCTNTSGVADSNTPLCASDGSPTQVRAKAYPTIRELEVVRALGNQGIVASLCPIQLQDEDAPDYGYKPAVAAIVERLKNALNSSCLPRSLRSGEATEGKVDCLVLAQLDKETGQTCAKLDLAVPDDTILKVTKAQLQKEGFDPDIEICMLDQKLVARGDSCAADGDIGWCYVEADSARKKMPAGLCPQGLVFSSGTARLTRARFSLQCIQQLKEGEAAGDTARETANSDN